MGTGVSGNVMPGSNTSSPSRGRTLDKAFRSPQYGKSPQSGDLSRLLPLPASLSATLESVEGTGDIGSSRSIDVACSSGAGPEGQPASCSRGVEERQSHKRPLSDSCHGTGMQSTTSTATQDARSSCQAQHMASAPSSPSLPALKRAGSFSMGNSPNGPTMEGQVSPESQPQRLAQQRHSRSLDSGMRHAAREAFNAARSGAAWKRSGVHSASQLSTSQGPSAGEMSDHRQAEKAEGLALPGQKTVGRSSAQLSTLIFSPDFPDTLPPRMVLKRSGSSTRAGQRSMPADAIRNATSMERSLSARGQSSMVQTLGTMPPRLPSRSPLPPPDRDVVQGKNIKKWLDRAGSSTLSNVTL